MFTASNQAATPRIGEGCQYSNNSLLRGRSGEAHCGSRDTSQREFPSVRWPLSVKSGITPYIFLALLFGLEISPAQTKFVLSGKGVYFFGPSQAELDSLEGTDSYEALADFTYYISTIGAFVEKSKLKSDYISNRIIEIRYSDQKTVVHRDSVDFGTILTDGVNKPRILEYFLTNTDFEEEIRDYFKLK